MKPHETSCDSIITYTTYYLNKKLTPIIMMPITISTTPVTRFSVLVSALFASFAAILAHKKVNSIHAIIKSFYHVV